MFVFRLKAAWAAFKNPHILSCYRTKKEKELRDLVIEILKWTKHKNSKWAIKAKKALRN
ncbi:MAG: hypothetical protein ACTSX6_08110 [Candidatus Heimdallarchaeaceae archaeon]